MDILEVFVQQETLAAAEITRIIKSTKIKKAYKNVHNIVQRIRSLYLIEETNFDKRRRHNERYFRLTDDGIYQLFLNRVRGVLVDQLSVKKGQIPVSYVGHFLKNYENNLLFKLFLYPYFENQTISVNNFDLLEKLFRYLHECCRRVDLIMHIGKDEAALLTSLKEIFSLLEWGKETANIRKTEDERTIL